MVSDERLVMMRKRHAILSESIKGNTSLDDYVKNKRDWFAVLGIDLTLERNRICIHFSFDNNDYEDYFIVQVAEDLLTVSPFIWCQNDFCANDILNVFSGKPASAKVSLQGRDPIYD